MPHTRKLLTAIGTLMLGTLGCRLLGETATPAPIQSPGIQAQPSATTPPTSAPSPTEPSPTPPPPNTPTLPPPQISEEDAIPHLAPGQEVVISEIKMFDEYRGWAIGGEQDPGDHILRTKDGARTWADVTPPEPAPAAGESSKVAFGYFLDGFTAWATYAYDEFFTIPEYPIIWFTADGGESWEARAYIDTRGVGEFYSPNLFRFIDADNGWLMVTEGAGMHHYYTSLFQTLDGGYHWEKVLDPFKSADLQSLIKTGMDFADANYGWVTRDNLGVMDGVHLLWTDDGGASWTEQLLPPPADQPDAFTFPQICSSHSPHLFSPQAGFLAVECYSYDGDKRIETVAQIYSTTDGGSTWDTTPYPGGELVLQDQDLAWALGREIHRSTDGGQTWTRMKTVAWDGQFSFVDAQVGWAVARSGTEIALVQTTNGGKTWLEAAPEIAP